MYQPNFALRLGIPVYPVLLHRVCLLIKPSQLKHAELRSIVCNQELWAILTKGVPSTCEMDTVLL